ncbi:response regulator [Schlesneria paludicola]|uniref:hypothetical protein n=1 Tax=Schlesneria paludicola TaxID=360056 RepID=UPI00029A7FD6|nr:hypothetical protein [Schlesneria paludicola]
MDQARVEFLLDDGWVLVGRFHQWLSAFPAMTNGRESVIELIDGLQRLWSMSDDLKLKRVSRICVGLEQLLERFCSRSLVFSAEELKDILTTNVSSLQEVLLGLEATREEPEIPDAEGVRKLERFSLQTIWQPVADMIPVQADAPSIPFELSIEPAGETQLVPHLEPVVEREAVEQDSIDDGLLTMLEQFVAQLDETCHRLHVRMVADQTPYVTTTSRLEHLAASTRELVEQIAQRSRSEMPAPEPLTLHEPPSFAALPVTQPLPLTADASEAQDQALSISNETIDLDETTEFLFTDLPSEVSVAYEPVPPVAIPSHRILIVEESLFYRHLICMAVQSAGFEPCMAESAAQALEILEPSDEFSAILIGETVSASLAQLIADRRQSRGLKVIGLTQTDRSSQEMGGVDGHVLRTQPQQLVMILNRLLVETTDKVLLSA